MMHDRDVLSELKDARTIINDGCNERGTLLSGERCKACVRYIDHAILLLKEQQQQIWELQDQVEYLTDKQKEQETELICNLLGGQPYEVYCRECRKVLCILGKGETMNDAKSIFSYCPHCGRQVKWE